jgi:hypothetical protein
MLPNLRPLSFGEILDGAFTLYRRNFLRFFGTALAFGTAFVVIAVIVGVSGAAVIMAFGGVVAVLGGLLTAAAIAGAAMALWGALTWQAGRAYAGKKTSIGDALDASVEAAGSLVGVGIVVVVILVAACLPGVLVGIPMAGMGQALPAFVLVAGWSLAAIVVVSSVLFAVLPAVVLEERGPLQAVARSFQLSSGSVGRIAGVMAVALLITALPGLGVQAMTGGLQGLLNPSTAAAQGDASVASELLGFVLNLLTAPFLACVCVVLYYDRRIRAEALDVQMMTDRLAIAGD